MKKSILMIGILSLCGALLAQEIPALPAQTGMPAKQENISWSSLKLPAQFPKGYPIRFGVLEFTTSAELLLEQAGSSLGKLLSVANNRSMALPLGASYLNVEIGRYGLEYFQIVPGKSGAGMTWEELQAAVLAGQVTHAVQCVVSDVRYAERNFVGYGIKSHSTDYSLDLLVFVYDLSRHKMVMTGSFLAELNQREPFNREAFVNDIFQNLLTKACRKAAEAIAVSASKQEDGKEPWILPVE